MTYIKQELTLVIRKTVNSQKLYKYRLEIKKCYTYKISGLFKSFDVSPGGDKSIRKLLLPFRKWYIRKLLLPLEQWK